MGYKHLDYLKRCQILAFWKAGYTQTQIAKEIGVNQSTISRELNRNIVFVRISGYAKKHQLFSLSKEWIYQFILKDKEKGGKLYLNLRHQNKKYRKRYGSPKRIGPIKNRRFIDERPKIIEEKSRIGDWEIDTIIGKQRQQAVISIVERFSKKTILKKVSKKSAKNVADATVESLKSFGSILSITADNGSEFAYHEKISKALNTEFYFAHPCSSWERGLNENTNGFSASIFEERIKFDRYH